MNIDNEGEKLSLQEQIRRLNPSSRRINEMAMMKNVSEGEDSDYEGVSSNSNSNSNSISSATASGNSKSPEISPSPFLSLLKESIQSVVAKASGLTDRRMSSSIELPANVYTICLLLAHGGYIEFSYDNLINNPYRRLLKNCYEYNTAPFLTCNFFYNEAQLKASRLGSFAAFKKAFSDIYNGPDPLPPICEKGDFMTFIEKVAKQTRIEMRAPIIASTIEGEKQKALRENKLSETLPNNFFEVVPFPQLLQFSAGNAEKIISAYDTALKIHRDAIAKAERDFPGDILSYKLAVKTADDKRNLALKPYDGDVFDGCFLPFVRFCNNDATNNSSISNSNQLSATNFICKEGKHFNLIELRCWKCPSLFWDISSFFTRGKLANAERGLENTFLDIIRSAWQEGNPDPSFAIILNDKKNVIKQCNTILLYVLKYVFVDFIDQIRKNGGVYNPIFNTGENIDNDLIPRMTLTLKDNTFSTACRPVQCVTFNDRDDVDNLKQQQKNLRESINLLSSEPPTDSQVETYGQVRQGPTLAELIDQNPKKVGIFGQLNGFLRVVTDMISSSETCKPNFQQSKSLNTDNSIIRDPDRIAEGDYQDNNLGNKRGVENETGYETDEIDESGYETEGGRAKRKTKNKKYKRRQTKKKAKRRTKKRSKVKRQTNKKR